MNIRDTHSYLVTLLQGLSITAPVSLTVKKAWKFTPPARVALGDLPCAISGYQLTAVRFLPAFLEQDYTVHIQLFIAPATAEQDQSEDIASAFLDALITSLSGHQRLNGNVSVIRALRGAGVNNSGGAETLTLLEWASIGYVGLDLFLDLTLKQTAGHVA